MKLGRVIGRVVCTQKMECFEGLKLLLVAESLQPHLKAVSGYVESETVRGRKLMDAAKSGIRSRNISPGQIGIDRRCIRLARNRRMGEQPLEFRGKKKMTASLGVE